MNITTNNRRSPRAAAMSRRGSVMTLMAFVLPVLALLAAFCVNTAHMQLTRTELVVATDAAARAGGRAFSEVQTVAAAKDAAKVTAALNTVNGKPLKIRDGDSANEIEFGKTNQYDGTSSRYHFEKIPTSQIDNGTVASAVRVNGIRDFNSLSGRVPLIIPGLLDKYDFGTTQASVAMQVDRDISMIIDRSGSMGEVEFDWPNNTSPWYSSTMSAGYYAGMLTRSYSSRRGYSYYYASGVSELEYKQWAWEEHYDLGTAPRPPWQDLVAAVDAFLDVLDTTSQEEQVSLASYSTYATLDTWLEKDHQVVRDKVGDLYPNGWTAIGRGMQSGINALLSNEARPFAAKTMVVMTDGIENRGDSAVTVAQSFMGQYLLTIHTVTFGEGADQALMQQVAAIGGGKHYHAADGDQLIAIFEEIANNLPTILTK
ncbi:vWA domain-containing protein [Planctomycetes bacterium K23_9]|uniref:von Willebrand factor type A domain protein n=1 Tax=Stieleria marina TaxID=1930275 RepID=A0A517NRZ9_9BACT|nr:von Willebrand factor type A domain protein [Planctomycetes bacterium K23_9]